MGELVAGAVLKHSRDSSTSPVRPSSARNSTRAPRRTTSSRPAGPACKPSSPPRTRSHWVRPSPAIAGGADTASDAPLGVNDELRRILLQVRRAKSPGARLRALARVRPSHLVPDIPLNAEPRTGLSYGRARRRGRPARGGATREAQDELAATSHQRLAAAYERGLFDDLVVPFRGLTRDQNLRPDSTPAELAALKPVFGTEQPDPTMTAGNSTPLTDGAATVLLASDDWAEARGLAPPT